MTAALVDAARALIAHRQPLTLAKAHGSHYHHRFMPSIPGISLHTNGVFRLSAISHQVGVPIKRSIQGGEMPICRCLSMGYVLEEMDWTLRDPLIFRDSNNSKCAGI